MRTIEYYDYDTGTWSGIDWSDVISGSMVRIYEQTINGVGDIWTIDIS